MSDENRENFVVTSEADKVVGFFSLSHYELSETIFYVEQGLRLHSQDRNFQIPPNNLELPILRSFYKVMFVD